MRPFTYHRVADAAEAIQASGATGAGQVDAPTQYLAGGTTQVDLMRLDVLRPQALIDLNALAGDHGQIVVGEGHLRLGALVRMSQAADHEVVRREYPAIAQSLELAASAQIRNMASLGGNVLQRTRCHYFRDTTWPCNKREPGSGCSALKGANRNFAVLGVDDSCIAQYPGDFAVALTALDAEVELLGPGGARTLPLEKLHRPAAGAPHLETTLKPGEVILGFRVPAAAWTRRSVYVKVRDRESYEFALASAAVALEVADGRVRQARIGLGGMAYTPWRAREAEQMLVGKAPDEAAAAAAAQVALRDAVVHGDNAFKPELARRTLVRAVLQAAALRA